MHGTQKTDRPLPGFVGGTLDRVDHVRTNPALLAQAFADPAARRLVLDGLEPVEVEGHLVLEPIGADAQMMDHVLLGVDRQARPIFARLVKDLGPNLGRVDKRDSQASGVLIQGCSLECSHGPWGLVGCRVGTDRPAAAI